MKEAEYYNEEGSLVLPDEEINNHEIGEFIDSDNCNGHVKLEDPENQQTMKSEEFENNDDFQRHL